MLLCGRIDPPSNLVYAQGLKTIDVNFVRDCHIISEDTDILQTRPSADCTVPSNDGAFYPSMILDPRTFKQHTTLKTNAIANDAIWTDCHIWTNSTVLANLGRRIDKNVPTVDEGLEQLGHMRSRGLLQRDGLKDETVSLQDSQDRGRCP